jgi:hypothetical protein
MRKVVAALARALVGRKIRIKYERRRTESATLFIVTDVQSVEGGGE